MRRSPMKRKPRKRQLSGNEMEELKAQVRRRDGSCVGKRAGILHACNADYLDDPEHLVDQRDIRNICGEGSAALTDTRLVTYCCRNLNSALFFRNPLVLNDEVFADLTIEAKDNNARAAIRAAAPEGFEAAVIEYGLESAADRKLGEANG